MLRVLILGGCIPIFYARLRDALDVLLTDRLPGVQLLTAGGSGIPASSARARNRDVLTVPPDHATHRVAAAEKQAEALVSLAGAVVVVWDGTAAFDGILARAEAKEILMRVLGVEGRGKRGRPVEPPRPTNLPD